MARFFHTPFPYLDQLRFRLLHVLIILAFSILFLIIFEPFRINDWIWYPEWLEAFGLASVGVCIALTIAFSQLLIRSLIPISTFTRYHFTLWTLSELLLSSLAATVIYTPESSHFLQEWLSSLKFIPTGLVLAYAFSMLVLIVLQKKNPGPDSESDKLTDPPDLVHIKDERGQVKFSIRKDDILYLESTDNYVTFFYLAEDEVKKEMVRTSMKKMEDYLLPFGLIRCHRSFMVNLENVQWMKKQGRNYQIKVKNCRGTIPVSRGYHSSVTTIIQE